MRLQAEKCRRLARTGSRQDASANLRGLAERLEAEAARSEKAQCVLGLTFRVIQRLNDWSWPFADCLVPATGSRFEPFVQLSVAADFLHIVAMEQRSLTAQEILEAVRPRFESDEAALAWYQSESLPGFGGRTAMQLVDIGYGSEVLEVIAAVDAGIYA